MKHYEIEITTSENGDILLSQPRPMSSEDDSVLISQDQVPAIVDALMSIVEESHKK